MEDIRICCIRCKGNIERFYDKLHCPACGATYDIIDGIPSFLAATDEFYEGRWVQSYTEKKYNEISTFIPWQIKKLIYDFYLSHSYSNRWISFIKKMLSGARGVVLDLGCNGGIEFYARIGPVAGVDLSLKALKHARKIYNTLCHADIESLPFPDESFDFVLSSLVLGHLPDYKKEKVYPEIKRVLKKGGLTIHVIETDGNSLKYLKQNNLWDRLKSYYGHDDLDTPTKAIQRFREQGLIPVVEKKLSCHVIPLGNFSQNLTEEIMQDIEGFSGVFDFLIRLDRFIGHYRSILISTNFLLDIIADIDNLFSSIKQAMAIGVCYKK